MGMKPPYEAFVKLYIVQGSGEGAPAIGSGLIALLRGVRDTGSLNRAAKGMRMAYSKAWKLMNGAEEHFGMKLIERDGARGSTLTPEAERLLTAFEAVSRDVGAYATRRLQEELAKAPSTASRKPAGQNGANR